MKVWSILWRLFYAGILVTGIIGAVGMGTEFVEIILPLCFGCLILNIPIYIYKKVNETELSAAQSYIDWTFHPVRTIILGILLAPVISVITIFNLVIESIKILFDRY